MTKAIGSFSVIFVPVSSVYAFKVTDVTPNRHTGESRYPERLTAPDSGFRHNDSNCSNLLILKRRRNISYVTYPLRKPVSRRYSATPAVLSCLQSRSGLTMPAGG